MEVRELQGKTIDELFALDHGTAALVLPATDLDHRPTGQWRKLQRLRRRIRHIPRNRRHQPSVRGGVNGRCRNNKER